MSKKEVEYNLYLETLKKTFGDYLIEKTCKDCGQKFEEWENTGQLNCRYHPEDPQSIGDGKEYYFCCHKERKDKKKPKGCCRGDHTAKGGFYDTRTHISSMSLFQEGGGLVKFPVPDSKVRVVEHIRKLENGQDHKDMNLTTVCFKRYLTALE
jgi:hypothetical protein